MEHYVLSLMMQQYIVPPTFLQKRIESEYYRASRANYQEGSKDLLKDALRVQLAKIGSKFDRSTNNIIKGSRERGNWYQLREI